jgi:hypothetical protein
LADANKHILISLHKAGGQGPFPARQFINLRLNAEPPLTFPTIERKPTTQHR